MTLMSYYGTCVPIRQEAREDPRVFGDMEMADPLNFALVSP